MATELEQVATAKAYARQKVREMEARKVYLNEQERIELAAWRRAYRAAVKRVKEIAVQLPLFPTNA